MDLHDALDRLADAHGIATEFWDGRGRHVAVSNESITRVLGALGVDAATPESAGRALAEQCDRFWTRMLPPSLVVRTAASPANGSSARRPSVSLTTCRWGTTGSMPGRPARRRPAR